MKWLIVIILLFAIAAPCLEAQTILKKNYTSSTTGDTLSKSKVKLKAIVFGLIAASDTVTIYNGSAIIAKLGFSSSPPAFPGAIPFYDVLCDTNLSIVKKGTSNVTVFYYRP
jgi:hypothetical protein